MNPLDTLTELYGEELAQAQLALEAEAYTIGEERFRAAMEHKAEVGQGADTRVARPLIADLIPKLVGKLQAFLADQASGKPGKKHAAFKHIRSLNMERVAYIAIRSAMASLLQAEPVLVNVTMNIGKEIEDEARFGRLREVDERNYNNVIVPNILKRSSDHFKRSYARAVEASMREDGDITAWDAWTASERNAVGLKLVEFLIELGTIEIAHLNAGNPKLHRQILTLTPHVAQWMAERTDFLAGMSPNFAPCVVPPKPWTSITSGGYWGRGRSNPRLLKIRSKRVLSRYKEVDLTRVLEAVNLIQNTPWAVNKQVLEVAKEVMTWKHVPVNGIESSEVTPLPERLADEVIETNPAALKAWKKEAAGAYRRERSRRSRRLSTEVTIQQAEKFAQFDRIWFPYNLDFRGRVYSIPAFSPQGTDLTKGLLLLADASPMGTEGEYWLRMHIANTAGLDKEPMDVRQKWTHDNEALILETAKAPLDNLWWATEADSPFCFLAACFEYANWKNSLNPKEYRCGLPIAFDGSCSGIQHFSAMLQDPEGGAAVNLIPADRPSDIYKIVADKVQKAVDNLLITGTDDKLEAIADEETGEITQRLIYGTKRIAGWWNSYGITRKVTKRSVMTLPYGSKEFGFTDQLLEDIVMPAVDKHGEGVFPQPQAAARLMAKLIWEALETTVVAAVGAMKWLQKAASAVVSEDMPIHWVTPVGFPVWQEYRKMSLKRVDTVICGSIRLTMQVAQDEDAKAPSKLDPHKNVNGISPNFVHSMDASHLMLTALAAGEQGVSHFAMIHDSFGTCPGNAGVMFKVVRETMVKTYSENDVIAGFYQGFADSLSEKAREKVPELPPKGDLKLESILESKYCFC